MELAREELEEEEEKGKQEKIEAFEKKGEEAMSRGQEEKSRNQEKTLEETDSDFQHSRGFLLRRNRHFPGAELSQQTPIEGRF